MDGLPTGAGSPLPSTISAFSFSMGGVSARPDDPGMDVLVFPVRSGGIKYTAFQVPANIAALDVLRKITFGGIG
ncbi:hypothetical protein O9993_16020 [Vibrio lentus]|nr:hypothetical protein [Vibrio lentus]